MSITKDLGCQTNLNVIDQLISLQNRFVIDAGCGSMVFTRSLVEQGARVLAIDPDPVQAKLNHAAQPMSNLEFCESGAEHLPVPPGSVDGVFFAYSLHHIPADKYPQVFDEVRRVLRQQGFLYVIEPLDCPWNQVMKLFHNEDQERAAAQQAMQELAMPYFESVRIVTYYNWAQYESWEEFATRFASKSFNTTYTEEDVRRPEVKEAFERMGGPEHRFQSPKQVVFMQGLRC